MKNIVLQLFRLRLVRWGAPLTNVVRDGSRPKFRSTRLVVEHFEVLLGLSNELVMSVFLLGSVTAILHLVLANL